MTSKSGRMFVEPSAWTQRWAQMAMADGLGALVFEALGCLGTRWDHWDYQTGLLLIAGGIALAVLAILSGLLALIKARGTTLSRFGTWIGLACAVLLLGFDGYWANSAKKSPPIHDVTTNLADPPPFRMLKMRGDNLVGVGSADEWRAFHAGAYSHLAPLYLRAPPKEALQVAEKIVRARGWAVASVTDDMIEATAVAEPMGTKEDIALRFTLSPDGKITQVDMRSVSREGVSDWGSNGKRIESFMNELRTSKPTSKPK
jgi:uncharacterized protein (DUF1499 family)